MRTKLLRLAIGRDLARQSSRPCPAGKVLQYPPSRSFPQLEAQRDKILLGLPELYSNYENQSVASQKAAYAI